jgi:Outer membrane protein beta-barrel domain
MASLKIYKMKKVITLILLISLSSNCLFAQKNAFRYGISLNPNYAYRYFYSDVAGLKKTVDALESGKISLSIGGFIEKKTSENARFRIGINLMNWGSEINRTGLEKGGSQNTNGGFNPLDSLNPNDVTAIRFTYSSWNVELPIDFQYFINKKHSFYFNAGISPLYNLGNYTTTKITLLNGKTDVNTTKDNGDNFQKLYVACQFGVGYERKINEKWSIDFQPRCQILFLDLANLSHKTGTIPYNVGLQMGLKF